MNRKGLFSLLFLFQLLTVSATSFHAYVKINTSECLKCYAAQVYTDKLSEITEVALLFPGNTHNYKRYLKIQYPVTVDNYKVIQSDSLFASLNKQVMSHFYLYNDKELVYDCPMKLLSRQFDSIVHLIEGKHDVYNDVSLPDTISFDNATLCALDGNYILFNRTYQEMIMYNGEQFTSFLSEQIPVLDLFKFFDATGEFTALYKKYFDMLSSLGRAEARITDIYLDSEYALLCVEVFYPFMQDNGNLGVKNKWFIRRVNIKNWQSTWLYVQDQSLPTSKYISSVSVLVSTMGDEIVLCVNNTEVEPERDLRYLATFEQDADTLKFNKMLNYELPEIHQVSGVYFDQLYPRGKKGFLMHQFSNKIIDLYKDSVFYLPIENKRLHVNLSQLSMEYDFILSDVSVKNNSCRFLYLTEDRHNMLGVSDSFSKDLSNNILLDIPNCGSNMVFANFYQFAYYDKNENAVKYKTINME